MGIFHSRQNADVEEADIGANNAYKYPPRSGNFFGSHFIMGGERFDTPQPEAYLFGENTDLNFLGNRPTAFPYPPPSANEPTKTLKSLVNIRKESVRFVRATENVTNPSGDTLPGKSNSFNIEFVFDCDASCAITIYYFCTEEITPAGLTYTSKVSTLTSETYHYNRGVSQMFSQPTHLFNPTEYPEEDLLYNSEREMLPIAIYCVVEEDVRQSHTTACVVDRHSDGTYVLRALKQKIFVDGLCYLLQEIYGIENKNINKANLDDDTEDNGSECVICMCDTRDTLILPCRHLCLCNSCADSLRYQANNCPICRAPFRALLQIRAVQRSSIVPANLIPSTSPQDTSSTESVPPGYVQVPLIEALNGPPQLINRLVTNNSGFEYDMAGDIGSASELNRISDKQSLSNGVREITKHSRDKKVHPIDFNLSVLVSKGDQNDGIKDTRLSNNGNYQTSTNGNTDKQNKSIMTSDETKSTENLHIVNERNANNLMMNLPSEIDEDSDSEKLSPLLSAKINNLKMSGNGIKTSNSKDEIAKDKDKLTDKNDCSLKKDLSTDCGDDDSENFFTPEDPHTTILSPLCSDKNKILGSFCTDDPTRALVSPVTAVKEAATTSLPDSPISGNSTTTRTSTDSYSSSSSTKKLLSIPSPVNNPSDYHGADK